VSAAHASTEALINSERAWLIAELEPQAVEGPDNRLYRKVGKNWVPMSTDEIWAGERTISPMRRVCLASNG
jgi:hypothetical protein